jgi:hypothetical protein
VVINRAWASLRPDHTARHDHQGAAFGRMMGLWWGDLITALREPIDARRAPRA